LAVTIPMSGTTSTKLAGGWKGWGRWAHAPESSALPGGQTLSRGARGWWSRAIRGALPPRSPSPRAASTAGVPELPQAGSHQEAARGHAHTQNYSKEGAAAGRLHLGLL